MHRQTIIDALQLYGERWVSGSPAYPSYDFTEEQSHYLALLSFVRENRACFSRSHLAGHITASALVTDPSLERVLLLLHAKLGKWLQLGGHCDEGEYDPSLAALREAREESGNEAVTLLSLDALWAGSTPSFLPFDIDIHTIKERGSEPAHFHYDLRYLCCLDPELPLLRNAESKDLRWLSLDQARALTRERSMTRQFDKLEAIRARLKNKKI